MLPRVPGVGRFCDAYGWLQDRGDLIGVIRTWGEKDDPGFDRMWAENHASNPLRDIAFLDEHREEWEVDSVERALQGLQNPSEVIIHGL